MIVSTNSPLPSPFVSFSSSIRSPSQSLPPPGRPATSHFVPLSPRSIRISASSSKPTSSSSSSSQVGYWGVMPGRNLVADWVSNNDEATRRLPIYVGGFALLGVLLNRAFSGIAPVADASSSQSRSDILSLSLAVTNLLTGLVWLSIRPKYISPEIPRGLECRRIYSGLPHSVVHELLWHLSCNRLEIKELQLLEVTLLGDSAVLTRHGLLQSVRSWMPRYLNSDNCTYHKEIAILFEYLLVLL